MKGTLTVRPVSANLQHDLRTFTKMCPYCFFRVDNQSGTTSSCKGAGKKPVWADRGIELRQANGFHNFSIRFEVMDEQNSEDVLIGVSEFNIKDYLDLSKVSSQNITTHLAKKDSYEGQLNVEIKWQPLIQRATRPPAMTVSQGPRMYNPVGSQRQQVMANNETKINNQGSNQEYQRRITVNQAVQPQIIQGQKEMSRQNSQSDPQQSYGQPTYQQSGRQQQVLQAPQPPPYNQPFVYHQPVPHIQQSNVSTNKPPSYNQTMPFSQYMGQSLPTSKKTYTPEEMDRLLDD